MCSAARTSWASTAESGLALPMSIRTKMGTMTFCASLSAVRRCSAACGGRSHGLPQLLLYSCVPDGSRDITLSSETAGSEEVTTDAEVNSPPPQDGAVAAVAAGPTELMLWLHYPLVGETRLKKPRLPGFPRLTYACCAARCSSSGLKKLSGFGGTDPINTRLRNASKHMDG